MRRAVRCGAEKGAVQNRCARLVGGRPCARVNGCVWRRMLDPWPCCAVVGDGRGWVQQNGCAFVRGSRESARLGRDMATLLARERGVEHPFTPCTCPFMSEKLICAQSMTSKMQRQQLHTSLPWWLFWIQRKASLLTDDRAGDAIGPESFACC